MDFITIELDFRRLFTLKTYKTTWISVCIYCAVLLFAGFVLQDTMNKINELKLVGDEMQKKIEESSKDILLEDVLQQQLVASEQEFASLQRDRLLSLTDDWLRIISDLAVNSGVSLGSVVVQKGKKELMYVTFPLKITLSGDFSQIYTFLQNLNALKKIVLLDFVMIKTIKGVNHQLQATLKLKFLTQVEYLVE